MFSARGLAVFVLISLSFIFLCTSTAQAADPVQGVVTNPEGEPVAGATISAIKYTEKFLTTFKIVEQATTGEDGRFTLKMTQDDARRSSTVTVFIVQHQDFGASCLFRRDQGGDFSKLEFKLPVGVSIAGTVVDTSGKAVSGAVVSGFMGAKRPSKPAAEAVWESRELFQATSDAAGRFSITGFPKDTLVSLRVQHPDYAPMLMGFTDDSEASTGELKAGDQNIKVVLKPGVAVSGKVVLEGGSQGVANANVALRIETENDHGVLLGGYATETQSDGTFTFPQIPAGKFSLAANAEAGSTLQANLDAVAPAAALDLVLRKHVEVTGKLVMADSEKGIAGGTITAHFPNGGDKKETTSKDDGTFSIAVPPEGVTIVAEVKNMDPEGDNHTVINIEPGKTPDPLTFTFKAPMMFTGRTLDGEGNPIAGVVVERRYGDRSTATSGEDGTFALPMRHQRFGQYESAFFKAHHPEKKELRGILMQQMLSEEDLKGDIVMMPAATIKGVVLDEEDQPLKGAKITSIYWTSNHGMHLTSAESDENGQYVLEDMPVHDQCSISAQGTTHGQAYTERFEVKAGETIEAQDLVLALADASIEGIVVDEEGNPAKDVNVHANGQRTGSRQGKTDAEGRFKIENVVEEQLYIHAYGRVGDDWKNGNYQAFGGDTEVEVTLGENQSGRSSDIPVKKLIDKPAPNLDIAAWVHGEAVSFEILKGKQVLLALWDSKNKNSDEFLDLLCEVKKAQGKSLCILLIHKAGKEKSVLKALGEEKALPFHIALDKPPANKIFPGKTAEIYTIRKLPGIFLIDEKGVVQYQNISTDQVAMALQQMKGAE